jgi:hypothetical protein
MRQDRRDRSWLAVVVRHLLFRVVSACPLCSTDLDNQILPNRLHHDFARHFHICPPLGVANWPVIILDRQRAARTSCSPHAFQTSQVGASMATKELFRLWTSCRFCEARLDCLWLRIPRVPSGTIRVLKPTVRSERVP